jgi:stage II sporulation protein D
MVYGDSLISAYYFSTCGGKTANIEDVWNKKKQPYLRSINDYNEKGEAYCAFSRFYSWEESWSISRISAILRRYSGETFPDDPASGTVKDICIESRFDCGRVKSCQIKTSTGRFTYGGDKLRFVLRRDSGENPILRSASITAVTIGDGRVTIRGTGNGHGVGMCQSGAIGRARAGQTFEQILKAYYTGVELKSVNVERK